MRGSGATNTAHVPLQCTKHPSKCAQRILGLPLRALMSSDNRYRSRGRTSLAGVASVLASCMSDDIAQCCTHPGCAGENSSALVSSHITVTQDANAKFFQQHLIAWRSPRCLLVGACRVEQGRERGGGVCAALPAPAGGEVVLLRGRPCQRRPAVCSRPHKPSRGRVPWSRGLPEGNFLSTFVPWSPVQTSETFWPLASTLVCLHEVGLAISSCSTSSSRIQTHKRTYH